jgi:TP901 family phage tail tape measure protein
MAEQVVFFRVEAEGVGDLVDQLGLLRREATQLQKEMRSATDPTTYTKLNRELENNKREQKAINATIKEQQKLTKETVGFAEGSYRKLDAELARLRRSYKELSQAEREGPGGAESLKRIQALDMELKQLDSTMGQFQRNVGNYPGGGFGAFAQGLQGLGGPLGGFIGNVQGLMTPLQDLASGLGSIGKGPAASATAGMEGLGAAAGGVGAGAMAATAGIAAAAIVIGKGVSNAMAFEDAFAQLSATLGVSGEEADRLKQRIDELQVITLSGGAEIVSTSTEIADAFTIVGSAAPQLLKNQAALQAVSKEVIVFSKSAGTDLTNAAKVVTGALNLFGLEATEANRVINTLAAGEKEGSATTLEAAEALEKAGGAAKITGTSLEETTAAIQLLAKDSIKGSEAGTALRNVLLKIGTASEETLSKDALAAFERGGVSLEKLRDTTVPLSEKLNELKKLTGDTAGLTAVFGTENINAAITLTKYADEFPKLTSAITGTNTAYDQAATKQETLSARIENLTNRFNNALTVIGQFFLPIIEALFDAGQRAFDTFKDLADAVGELTGGLGDAGDAGQFFADAYTKLSKALQFIVFGPIRALTFALRELPAVWAGVTAVFSSFPEFLGNLFKDAITKVQIFGLRTKATFKDAAEFISFGLANGGAEITAEADRLQAELVARQQNNVNLIDKFAEAYNATKAKQAEASKQAAEQIQKQADAEAAAAALAEELAKKEAERLEQLEKDKEAAAEAAKKREAEAKKRAEEEAKRAEIERRNLNFLREELAKVEAQLKAYTDKSLIPTELLKNYQSLKSEIASTEKALEELFKQVAPEVVVTAVTDKTSIQKVVKDFNDMNYSMLLNRQSAQDQESKVVQDGGKRDVDAFIEIEELKKKRGEELKKALIDASFKLAKDANDAIFKLDEENDKRRLDKQLELLEQQEAQQLELVEGNAQAEQDVREQFAQEREQLEREAFEKKKERDIAQAIMNAALAITQVFATTPFPLSIIAAALTAATTAVQIATIAAQEYALGGRIGDGFDSPKAEHGIFVGPSHAGGGINTRLSGRRVNVEGGEYFERLADGSSVVVNKRSTSRFRSALMAQAGRNYPGKLAALSAINQYGGGVPLMATGGVVAPMTNAGGAQSTAQLELLGLALDKLSNRVPVLTLQSFDTVNSRANQVKTLQGL